MTMMTKKLFLLCAAFCITITTFSQKNDFGIYYCVGGEIKLVRKLELDIVANLRTLDNASRISQIFVEPGLTYKLSKFLSVGAGYRFTSFYEDDDTFHPRHRWYSDIKAKFPAGEFKISARIRFQQSFKTYFEDESDKDPYDELRFRLKTLYNITSFPVNPYLAAELYMPVLQDHEKTIDTRKFMAGAEYNISKKHSVELEYMYQHDFLPKEKSRNILSVNYNFKF